MFFNTLIFVLFFSSSIGMLTIRTSDKDAQPNRKMRADGFFLGFISNSAFYCESVRKEEASLRFFNQNVNLCRSFFESTLLLYPRVSKQEEEDERLPDHFAKKKNGGGHQD